MGGGNGIKYKFFTIKNWKISARQWLLQIQMTIHQPKLRRILLPQRANPTATEFQGMDNWILE